MNYFLSFLLFVTMSLFIRCIDVGLCVIKDDIALEDKLENILDIFLQSATVETNSIVKKNVNQNLKDFVDTLPLEVVNIFIYNNDIKSINYTELEVYSTRFFWVFDKYESSVLKNAVISRGDSDTLMFSK